MCKTKVPLNLPVREVVWIGLRHVAERERKKLSEIAGLTLEWSVDQLREAGSINRLLRSGIQMPCKGQSENTRPGWINRTP